MTPQRQLVIEHAQFASREFAFGEPAKGRDGAKPDKPKPLVIVGRFQGRTQPWREAA